MGFFDRAKSALGLGAPSPKPEDVASSPSPRSGRAKGKDGRPPLPEITTGATATVEDVLQARAAGAFEQARSILAAIDKGQGLRTVLRAAAALEAKDDDELRKLLPLVAKEPAWQLRLQVAAALEPGPKRLALIAESEGQGAPAWATAWLRALSPDENERRQGLVDLLFEDPGLARTVAARELGAPPARPDAAAIRRYTAFAHGRDAIRRFGAEQVSELLDRLPKRAP